MGCTLRSHELGIWISFRSVCPGLRLTHTSRRQIRRVGCGRVPRAAWPFWYWSCSFFRLLAGLDCSQRDFGADPEGLTNAIETQLSAQNSGSKSDAEKPAAAGSANTQSSSAGGSNGEAARTGASEEHEETEAELHERLTKLVSAAPVMLFMKGTPAAPSCGFRDKWLGFCAITRCVLDFWYFER